MVLASQEAPFIMEPEGLLLCWQETTTSPYPEPDESNTHPPILLPKINLKVSFRIYLGILSGLFLSDFSKKYYMS
jgi:hypothetical protein